MVHTRTNACNYVDTDAWFQISILHPYQSWQTDVSQMYQHTDMICQHTRWCKQKRGSEEGDKEKERRRMESSTKMRRKRREGKGEERRLRSGDALDVNSRLRIFKKKKRVMDQIGHITRSWCQFLVDVVRTDLFFELCMEDQLKIKMQKYL